MLRLLDNEALDVEDPAVETVKDMLDDYLERNQDDFDEFDTPDDIYEGIMAQLEGLEVRRLGLTTHSSATAWCSSYWTAC